MRFDGLLLRDYRRRRALTTRELGARAGVSAVTVTMLENGHRQPHMSTLRKLADALGVDPEALFSDREEPDLKAAA
jgi:transcriptional regulator with XRE-family HTH domain